MAMSGRGPWVCVHCNSGNYQPPADGCHECSRVPLGVLPDEEPEPEMVAHPAHYTYGGAECIDVLFDLLGAQGAQDYCVGNAFKYLWRHKHKGRAVQDLKKARFYLDFLLSKLDEQEDPRGK